MKGWLGHRSVGLRVWGCESQALWLSCMLKSGTHASLKVFPIGWHSPFPFYLKDKELRLCPYDKLRIPSGVLEGTTALLRVAHLLYCVGGLNSTSHWPCRDSLPRAECLRVPLPEEVSLSYRYSCRSIIAVGFWVPLLDPGTYILGMQMLTTLKPPSIWAPPPTSLPSLYSLGRVTVILWHAVSSNNT